MPKIWVTKFQYEFLQAVKKTAKQGFNIDTKISDSEALTTVLGENGSHKDIRRFMEKLMAFDLEIAEEDLQ